MTIETLAADARQIWGEKPMTLDHITLTIGVVHGDICRQARAQKEGRAIDDAELQKELGNLIFSCIRWCEDLGYDPTQCIELAKSAQKKYAQENSWRINN